MASEPDVHKEEGDSDVLSATDRPAETTEAADEFRGCVAVNDTDDSGDAKSTASRKSSTDNGPSAPPSPVVSEQLPIYPRSIARPVTVEDARRQLQALLLEGEDARSEQKLRTSALKTTYAMIRQKLRHQHEEMQLPSSLYQKVLARSSPRRHSQQQQSGYSKPILANAFVRDATEDHVLRLQAQLCQVLHIHEMQMRQLSKLKKQHIRLVDRMDEIVDQQTTEYTRYQSTMYEHITDLEQHIKQQRLDYKVQLQDQLNRIHDCKVSLGLVDDDLVALAPDAGQASDDDHDSSGGNDDDEESYSISGYDMHPPTGLYVGGHDNTSHASGLDHTVNSYDDELEDLYGSTSADAKHSDPSSRYGTPINNRRPTLSGSLRNLWDSLPSPGLIGTSFSNAQPGEKLPSMPANLGYSRSRSNSLSVPRENVMTHEDIGDLISGMEDSAQMKKYEPALTLSPATFATAPHDSNSMSSRPFGDHADDDENHVNEGASGAASKHLADSTDHWKADDAGSNSVSFSRIGLLQRMSLSSSLRSLVSSGSVGSNKNKSRHSAKDADNLTDRGNADAGNDSGDRETFSSTYQLNPKRIGRNALHDSTHPSGTDKRDDNRDKESALAGRTSLLAGWFTSSSSLPVKTNPVASVPVPVINVRVDANGLQDIPLSEHRRSPKPQEMYDDASEESEIDTDDE